MSEFLDRCPDFTADPRDWVEDFPQENGKYMRICCECDNSFIGNKHRIICKQCYLKNQEEEIQQLTERVAVLEGRIEELSLGILWITNEVQLCTSNDDQKDELLRLMALARGDSV